MITAREALELSGAKISKQDMDDLRDILDRIDKHIRSKMVFAGPTPLEVPYRHMSMTASKILVHLMKRSQWIVSIQLFSEAPRFAGGAPEPHHWAFAFKPMDEVYDELLADFDVAPSILDA